MTEENRVIAIPRSKLKNDLPHIEDGNFRRNVLQQPNKRIITKYNDPKYKEQTLIVMWHKEQENSRETIAGLLQNNICKDLVYICIDENA